MMKQKSPKRLLISVTICLLFFFVQLFAAYACHGGSIFYFVGSLDTTSEFDDSNRTLAVSLSNKTIAVSTPISSYNSTYDNYTMAISPCELAKEYQGVFVEGLVVENAVYSFEAVNGSRLDQDGNGKMDVYNRLLPNELDLYGDFLVVPIEDMGNVTNNTLYTSDAIIYVLDEPYGCMLCTFPITITEGGPTGGAVLVNPLIISGVLAGVAVLFLFALYYVTQRKKIWTR